MLTGQSDNIDTLHPIYCLIITASKVNARNRIYSIIQIGWYLICVLEIALQSPVEQIIVYVVLNNTVHNIINDYNPNLKQVHIQ